jgi:hypothetical protein
MQKLLVTAATIAALALVAPSALAYPPWVYVIRDCADDGKIEGTYRPQDLAQALRNVPSDGNEYSDCTNGIRHALDGGSGKHDGLPPNGIVTESGAVAASAEDAAALQTVIAAADTRDPTSAPAARRASEVEAVVGGLDRSSAPAYRVDVGLLTAVLAGGLALIAGASALRRRGPRRAA